MSDAREKQHDDKQSRRYAIEIIASILLAIAVVGTAYSAWQATRWSGVQAIRFAEAATLRVESAKAQSTGIQQLAYDATTFIQFATLVLQGDRETAETIADRFMREEFEPFARQWLALRPLQNPDTPRNPFELENFRNEQIQEARRLEARASEKFEQAKDANQTGDNYILATVFFAVVLFFAGLSSKFEGFGIRMVLLALAGVGLIIGIVRIATLPFF